MPDLHVTSHAISRYRSRVAPVSADEATERLSCAAIRKAAEFGARLVKLGTGQHVVLDGFRVVTVLPRDTFVGVFDPRRMYD